MVDVSKVWILLRSTVDDISEKAVSVVKVGGAEPW